MASVKIDPVVAQNNPPHVEPAEIYYGSYENEMSPIQLRIATGGAGQSGLVRALADAFIDTQVKETGCKPFAVAWLKSDTAGSFNNLAQASADLSITYHPAAEDIAMEQGFAERSVYAWRDHFMLVGPSTNPAQLTLSPTTSIQTLFSQLFRGAVANPSAVRFLSRYDKSATNIKESYIWTTIGQALQTAAKLGEYTLVDRGTWWGVEGWVREKMTVFMEAHDNDKDHILLNPAHALVGSWGKHKDTANAFVDWMVRDDGGQKVASGFRVNGAVLYTKAPKEERAGK
ncbi:MAG: hypothetical protein Q9181_005880 [Wetmoreana brouardii]